MICKLKANRTEICFDSFIRNSSVQRTEACVFMKCNTYKKCPCLELIFLLHFIPQNHIITKLGEGSWRALVQLHHTPPLLKQRHPAQVTQGCDHFAGIQSDCLYSAERLCHSLVAEASCCPQKNTQHTPCSYQQGSETWRTQPTAFWKAGNSLHRGRREGKWPSKKFFYCISLFAIMLHWKYGLHSVSPSRF